MPSCVFQSDLKAVTDAKGGSFYKEHLPILGENEQTRSIFSVGDRVRVDLEIEVIKTLQDGHGGWSDGMSEVSKNCGMELSLLSVCCAQLSFVCVCTFVCVCVCSLLAPLGQWWA